MQTRRMLTTDYQPLTSMEGHALQVTRTATRVWSLPPSNTLLGTLSQADLKALIHLKAKNTILRANRAPQQPLIKSITTIRVEARHALSTLLMATCNLILSRTNLHLSRTMAAITRASMPDTKLSMKAHWTMNYQARKQAWSRIIQTKLVLI